MTSNQPGTATINATTTPTADHHKQSNQPVIKERKGNSPHAQLTKERKQQILQIESSILMDPHKPSIEARATKLK